MASLYEFLKPTHFSFFDENDGMRGEIDLMGFSFDGESSYGMLEKIVTEARGVLSGASPSAAMAMLWIGDTFLDVMLDKVSLISSGKKVSRDQVSFKAANQFDFISLVLMELSARSYEIGDENFEVDNIEVTPAKFCAAYVLRMAFNASRDYLAHSDGSDLRDYYLMQASAAYGLMKSFEGSEEMSISGAVSLSIRSRSAKDAAAARWRDDPKAKAMGAIRAEWDKMNRGERPHKSDAAFAREMHAEHSDVIDSDGSIKNAITRWRKE